MTIFLDTCFSGSTRENDTLLAARPVSIVPKDLIIPDNFLIFSAASFDEIAIPLDEVKAWNILILSDERHGRVC